MANIFPKCCQCRDGKFPDDVYSKPSDENAEKKQSTWRESKDGPVAAALSSRADAERTSNRRDGEGVICVLGRAYVCADNQAARFCQKK